MHKAHSFTSLHALYRVFVLPALSTHHHLRAQVLAVNRRLPSRRSPSRQFSVALPLKFGATPPRHQTFDEDIRAQYVKLVNPETNKVSEPIPRSRVLKKIDTTTHRLVQLTPDEPKNPEFTPICKVVSKKELYESERRRKEAQKEAKKSQSRSSADAAKTIELNWAIDSNDLGHRMNRMREFLEEGRTVKVLLAAKKRGRKATTDECATLLKRIREVAQNSGAKEKGEMEGKIGGLASLILLGKASAPAVGEPTTNAPDTPPSAPSPATARAEIS